MEITYPSGVKWTKQRKCVYEVLYHAKEPLSATQIYHDIVKHPEKMEEDALGRTNSDPANYAVSTIYRILTTFEEKGLIIKSNRLDSNTFVYELARGGHTHYAVCLSCHKHILLHSCPFEHMHLPDTDGDFKITGHKLELYGYCGSCQPR